MSRPMEPKLPEEAKPFRPRDTRRAVARALGRVLAAARESGLQVKVPDHLESPVLKNRRAAQNLRQALSGESASQVRTIEGILAEARIEVHRSAPAALSRAQEALSALDAWTVPPALRRLEADLRAEVLGQIANAYRILGSFEEATRSFELARLWAKSGSLDPLITANLDGLESNYISEGGDFERAHRLVRDAMAIYRDLGDLGNVTLCRGRLARNYYLAGRLQLALTACLPTLSARGCAKAPLTGYLAALSLIANVYLERGEHHRALICNQSYVSAVRSLGLNLALLRGRWHEGLALLHLREPHRAAEVLEPTRQELVHQGLFEEAVNVSLDLAQAYSFTWHGKYSQSRIAREVLGAVDPRALSPGCASALSNWVSAALAGRASEDLIRDARYKVKRWNSNAGGRRS
jgi:tetratricopeptide (TPR) repeat protein